MKIQRNNKILSLFVATFIVFAGVLFFGNHIKAAPASFDDAVEVTEDPNAGDKPHFGDDLPLQQPGDIGKVAGHNSLGQPSTVVCRDVDFDWGAGIIICALLEILDMTGSILEMSLDLFKSVVDAKKTTDILSSDAILKTWGTVRDLANLSFILILLFSAFATIFQADKYNYKKILLWVIIMALLVNFSYPITLFIIDINNSLMYTLFNKAFHGGDPSIMGLTDISGPLEKIISPGGENASVSRLLLSIIFIFILALTVLALAFILLIRTIALAIIIILSPLGFVGVIIGKGGDWWNNLFKYALAGPIIALVFVISIELMAATTELTKNDDALDGSLVAEMASFTIPIVILWMGMAMAVKGIEGAGAVMGKVRGGGVNLAKKMGKGAWNATGVPGTIKQTADHYKKKGILGVGGSERRENKEKKWTAALTGDKGYADRKEQHDMAEKSKKYKDENETVDNLKTKCAAGDAAACHRLAEDGDMDTKTYKAMSDHASISPKLKSSINKKVRQKRADLAVSYDVANADLGKARSEIGAHASGWSDAQVRDHLAEEKMGSMNAEKLAEQNWVDINKLPTDTPEQIAEKTRIAGATLSAIGGLTREARLEFGKRLSPANKKAINALVGRTII